MNNQPQQPYPAQPQTPQRSQQQHGTTKTESQAAPGRRRGPGIIGRGLLPLSDGLSIQEYERRRKHNSEKAEENKKVQRERNNEAARRSRQRRADLISSQSSEIQRLSQEVGALTRERDYWKGVVEHMQGSSMSGGVGRAQQKDQPPPQQQQQQQTLPSQYLAYPAGMTPSASVNSTPLSHIAVAPPAQVLAQQQMPTAQFPAVATPSHLPSHITPSQLMHPFPDIAAASAQAHAQGTAALATAPFKNNHNSPLVTQTLAPVSFDTAATGHADGEFAVYPFLPSVDTPDNTTASDAVGGLDESEFFQQIDEYDTDVKNGGSSNAMENFNFSISGNN